MVKIVYKTKKMALIGALCFCSALLFYALTNEWIVILFDFPFVKKKEISAVTGSKKRVPLWYIKNKKWQKDEKELVLSGNQSQALFTIIETWLATLAEENIGKKKPHLEAVSLSLVGDELFVSFDRSPFSRGLSTYEKMSWAEGLLRTVGEVNGITKVRLLVHHQPLQDGTLDFSFSWPTEGFLPR